ncbi:MAG: hypothetical protein J6W88_05010 [Bacteroidales bacterium]|nr:hypothetical protein [Bacteroidales bacterium]
MIYHKKTVIFAVLGALTILLTACSNEKTEEVHFLRFERLIFKTKPSELQHEMLKHRDEYNTELILFAPEQEQYMQMVTDFVSDPVMRDVFRITDSVYSDLSNIEKELGRALHHAYTLYPSMPRVEHFYTMVTGQFDNYPFRIFSNTSEICISLDQYALQYMESYGYFGTPKYIVQLCSPQQIVPDCIRLIAKLNIQWPETDQTLLDYAIAEGKAIYFAEQTMPHLHDTILLRYTGEQLDWMRHNTRNVWGWLLENKLLYSTDNNLFHNIIDDAPKTNAFGDGSAPRTTDYIGWQIVRAYAKKTDCSIEELFMEDDSQKILNISGWRPK